MEYNYRIRPKEKETIIQLQAYDMVVINDATKRTIPYAEITDIRLNKSRHLYFLHIDTFDGGNITVMSQSYGHSGEKIDQSHAYLTFTRVLHMHLLEKSKASYSTGFNSIRLLFVLGSWITFCFLLFFAEMHFNFIPASPFVVAGMIFSVGVLWLAGLQLNHWPRPYNPTNIPLQLLPSAT